MLQRWQVIPRACPHHQQSEDDFAQFVAGGSLAEKILAADSHLVTRRVGSVWALGVPFPTIYGWLETDLRIKDTRAFYALAIDVHREAFEPALWKTAVEGGGFPPRPVVADSGIDPHGSNPPLAQEYIVPAL
jgi:hypothetical protein